MPAHFRIVLVTVLLIHHQLIPSATATNDSDDDDDRRSKKCSTLPQVQHRLNAVIVDCQNQVKEDMIRDALQQIRFSDHHQQLMHSGPSGSGASTPPTGAGYPVINPAMAANREDIHWMVKRYKRELSANTLYDHPTIMSSDDKEIAGCLMKCFFKKANALDFFGYPTLDGLVNLYTENVSDHNYFMAVLKITNFCLKGVNIKYKINQKTGNDLMESCNVAFDTFDCISDQIMDYCSGTATK